MKKIITTCLILLSCISGQVYAQSQSCSQGQESNNFEHCGDFTWANSWADDFRVNGSTTNFTANRITANIFTSDKVSTSPIYFMNVFFYSDNSGVPGAQIASFLYIVPTSQNIIGTATKPAMGNPIVFDVREVVIDLPTPLSFSGSAGTDADAVYWVELEAVPTASDYQTAWETTTLSIKGYPATGSNILFPQWESTASSSGNLLILYNGGAVDFVFTIEGTCTSSVSCPEPQNLGVSNITATGADLSWNLAPAASGYNWYVFADGADPSTATPVDSGSTSSGTATTVTATGLPSSSSYDFYVESICGQSDQSLLAGPTSFNTPIINDDLADAIPLIVDAACAGTYTVLKSTIQQGEPTESCFQYELYNSVWFSFVAPASGAVTVTTDIPLGTAYDTAIAVYAAPSNLNDPSTLPPEEGCDDDGGTIVGPFGKMSILELAALIPGNTYYIKVMGNGDFCIEVHEGGCPHPSDLTVSGITANSADVGWTENGLATEWEIEYGPTGFTPGSGTIVTDNDGVPGETISGLTNNTSYDVYVTTICGTGPGPNAKSDRIGPETFTAATCPDVANLVVSVNSASGVNVGWTENGFATEWEIEYGPAGFAPGSGTIVTDNDGVPGKTISGLTPGIHDFYVTAICGSGNQSNHVGPKSFKKVSLSCSDIFTDYNSQGEDYDDADVIWVASPTTPGDVVTITFDPFAFSYHGYLDVYDGPDTSAPLIYTGKPSGYTVPGPYTSTHPSGALTLVFIPNGYLGRSWKAYVTCGPRCPAPTALNAFHVLDTSIDLSWAENGAATEWEIEYGPTGFAPGTGTIISDNDGTLGVTISSLTPNTTYDFYVTAICGAGNESAQVGPKTVATLGIEDLVFVGFSFYPNPVKGYLSLKATSEIDQVVIYNLLGREVLNFRPNELDPVLNLESLHEGIYLMKVGIEGKQGIFKVVKK